MGKSALSQIEGIGKQCVYVVVWEGYPLSMIKVGVTSHRANRCDSFIGTGARLSRVFCMQRETIKLGEQILDLERILLNTLSMTEASHRAFDSAPVAARMLPPVGAGWTECYIVPTHNIPTVMSTLTGAAENRGFYAAFSEEAPPTIDSMLLQATNSLVAQFKNPIHPVPAGVPARVTAPFRYSLGVQVARPVVRAVWNCMGVDPRTIAFVRERTSTSRPNSSDIHIVIPHEEWQKRRTTA